MNTQYIISFFLFSTIFGSCTSWKYSYEEQNLPKFTGKYSSKPILQSNVLRVATYNIEFAKNIDEAIEVLTSDTLRDIQILLLQEMDEVSTDELAQALKMNYIYYPSIFHPGQGKNVGNAILSKWPIKSSRKIKLPKPSSYPSPFHGKNYKFRKIASLATVEIRDKSVTCVSTHAAALNSTENRKIFSQALVDSIGLLNLENIIVGGDFNCLGVTDTKATATSFLHAGFQWASEDIGITVSEKKHILKILPDQLFQLDHIFIKGLKIKKVGKFRIQEVSDHFPIYVDLILN